MLAACSNNSGGNDGGSGGGGGGSTALVLTGVAATGAAIAGGTVDAKCATGSGSTTSAADGSYSISIAGGALPCLLRVTSGTTVLHSAAAGSGSSAVGHITPATQMIVARLRAAEPATAYAAFDATAAAGVTAGAIGSAQAAVVATLKPSGVDFSAIADLFGGSFRPRVGSTAGDAYDQALDALAARLAGSGTTLATLTTALVAEAANLGNTTPSSGTVSLPPIALLQPAAANCSALRSGTYRVISPTPNATLGDQAGLLTINASTLVTRDTGSTVDNPVWVANGSCRYLTDGGTTDLAVSQAGLVVARTSMGGSPTRVLAWAMPEQTHTLAELAGTWNLLGLSRNPAGGAYFADAATLTLSATGAMSDLTDCSNAVTWSVKGSDCVGSGTEVLPTLRVNATGGFDLVEPNETTARVRVFAYRAGNGELMLVNVDADGSFTFWTRRRTNTLPTVGAVTTSWNFYENAQLGSTQALDASTNVITSVDATAGSYLRAQSTLPQTDVTRPESLFANNPRNGYNFRVGGPVVNSAGATVNVSEFTALPLRGMGASALILPASKTFLLSVNQP